MKNKKTILKDLGLIDYQQAWDYQTQLFEEIIAIKLANRQRVTRGQALKPTANYVIFCEHPHVYTLGKNGNSSNLLVNELGLKQAQAAYYKINRGGDITYHGPGQIVVYPIIDLDNFFTDIHRYLRLLEEVIIRTLNHYKVDVGRVEKLTGVWVDVTSEAPRKICAMGVKAGRWVTMHGLALNVNTDLSYFDRIVPCGISNRAVTSLAKELGEYQDTTAVKELIKKYFVEIFAMDTRAF